MTDSSEQVKLINWMYISTLAFKLRQKKDFPIYLVNVNRVNKKEENFILTEIWWIVESSQLVSFKDDPNECTEFGYTR